MTYIVCILQHYSYKYIYYILHIYTIYCITSIYITTLFIYSFYHTNVTEGGDAMQPTLLTNETRQSKKKKKTEPFADSDPQHRGYMYIYICMYIEKKKLIYIYVCTLKKKNRTLC